MRRLTLALAGRLRLLRSDETGAAAVLVALMGVVLLGFAALAIDYGAAQAQRAQLQNAADAVAFAIAGDCAAGNATGCAATGPGLDLGAANGAGTTAAALDPTARTVTATTTSIVTHWFAPVFGVDSSTVRASATAQWTAGTSGDQVVTRARVYAFAIEECQQPAQLPSGRLDIRTNTRLCGGPYKASGGRAYVVVVQEGGSCAKTAVSVGATVRQSASGNLDCKLPSSDHGHSSDPDPIVVRLWDEVSPGQNVNRRDYRTGSFALFQPDGDRLAGSGIRGWFIPMDLTHPDILETSPSGSGSPGTVTLID